MDELKFNTMTEAYRCLNETHKALKEAEQKIELDFKDPEDHYFSNPINYKTNLDEVLNDARRIFTRFVVNLVNKEYQNISINEEEIQKFVTERQNFDASEVIKRIRELYTDVDGIALKQIRDICSEMLPWGVFGDTHCTAYKPEHIPMINTTGIQLRSYGDDYRAEQRISALIKLTDIVLRGAKPSQARGHEVEHGQTYRDDRIKSLRYFKNGSLKVLFNSDEDCEKVKHALFEDSFKKTVEEHVKNMGVPESTGQQIIDTKTAVEEYLGKEGSQ